MRVLAVQVDERGAEIVQLRERRRTAVDPRAAASLRIERAAHQHGIVVLAQALVLEPRQRSRRVARIERRRQLRALRAGLQLAKLEAIAEQQRERVEQDGLAGARLARQHGKPAVELQLERFDDDEVADGEQP